MYPKLNYRIMGDGQPVIILHGLFGMLDNWITIGKKLSDAGYMTILIDQRDHGRSEHTSEFNYKVLSDDLYQFMEDHWIHSAILIGHSMGGKTALQFVADHTTDIRKLIVVDIGIKAYPGGHEDVFKALLSVELSKIKTRDEAEKTILNIIRDNGTVQFLMKNLTRHKDGHFEWKMNLPLLFKNYKNILAPVSINHTCLTDTLFIRGELSDYITNEDLPEIEDLFPNAKFKSIPSAGHWVHADQPDELFKTIIDFIKG
jgi:esterase